MSQFDYGNIDEAATSGVDLGLLLEQSRDANHSNQKGSIRPSYVVPGMMWIDDSTTPWNVNFFDGVNDLRFASIDNIGHILRITDNSLTLATVATSADFSDLINVPAFGDLSISPTDTTPSDLTAKLFTGTGLVLTTQNAGANETRTIDQDFATQLEAETGSDNTKPMNALRTKQAIDTLGTPPGTVLDFAGISAPLGFLPCDGAAVSRTTFAPLFAAINTLWGAGDGSTTFNVPDLSRRTTIGAGGVGTSTIGSTVGSIGGEEKHALTSGENASHTHIFDRFARTGAGTTSQGNLPVGSDLQKDIPTSTQSSGSGIPHNTMQPSAVMLKIIKT